MGHWETWNLGTDPPQPVQPPLEPPKSEVSSGECPSVACPIELDHVRQRLSQAQLLAQALASPDAKSLSWELLNPLTKCLANELQEIQKLLGDGDVKLDKDGEGKPKP